MKQFFKFMFATILGFFLSIIILFFVGGGILIGIASAGDQSAIPVINDNSILHLELDKEIKDRPSNDPFENFDFINLKDRSPMSLGSIIENIDKAANDDRIKGIYLDIASLKANLSSTDAIRRALEKFKESGKFIVAYNENYSQLEYYLNSVADEVYLHPSGDLTFKGLAAQLMFFKDAFERLDLDMQIIRHGKFKSAIEPFIRNDMSPENELQLRRLIDGIWDHQLSQISKSRNLEVSELNRIADGLLIRTADAAKELGLVDDILYEDEVRELLLRKVQMDTEEEQLNIDDLNLLALSELNKVKNAGLTDKDREARKSKNKIAVIYAEGEIISGESSEGSMGSETIAEAIKEARNDSKVKAIVLRVNSPGGSALASDVIWRETILAKKEKPLIVSMGDMAASGGYYIACAADKIYAEKASITGSIGVFGVIPNMQGTLNKKMGIHIDEVGTNAYSDGITPFRALKQTEIDALTDMVEEVYDQFTSKVADGRKMSQAKVDSLGQGRVWSGLDAKEIGLIDELGGLDEAILAAAEMAEVEDYKIKTLPKKEDPMQKLLQEFAAQSYAHFFAPPLFGKAEKYYMNIKQVFDSEGIYTRLPVSITID